MPTTTIEFYDSRQQREALARLIDGKYTGFVELASGELARLCDCSRIDGEWYHDDQVAVCSHCECRYVGDDAVEGEHDNYCSSVCRDEAEDMVTDSWGRERNRANSQIYGYHEGPTKLYSPDADLPYLVGFEIEKEDEDVKESLIRWDLILEDFWKAERDGSLHEDGGFELISPAFNMSRLNQLITHPLPSWLATCVNADTSHRCGGHITISRYGWSGQKLLDHLDHWIPVWFSLFPRRLRNEYSEGQRKKDLRGRNCIEVARDKIEIRVPNRVHDVSCLQRRAELVRLMLIGLDWERQQVESAMEPDGQIGKIFAGVYTAKQWEVKQALYPAFHAWYHSDDARVPRDIFGLCSDEDCDSCYSADSVQSDSFDLISEFVPR